MRVVLRRQYGAEIGGAAGAAAVTAAGEPELIPIAAPLGAKAGEYAESEIKKFVKKDDPLTNCEDLTNLRYLWDGEMMRVVGAVNARNYEEAEARVAELLNLDSRILRSVNCHERNQAQSIHVAITR